MSLLIFLQMHFENDYTYQKIKCLFDKLFSRDFLILLLQATAQLYMENVFLLDFVLFTAFSSQHLRCPIYIELPFLFQFNSS
jgi:hypothetical protein